MHVLVTVTDAMSRALACGELAGEMRLWNGGSACTCCTGDEHLIPIMWRGGDWSPQAHCRQACSRQRCGCVLPAASHGKACTLPQAAASPRLLLRHAEALPSLPPPPP